jgi:hypothetical protein
MVTYWGIGATSSEFNKLLEMPRLAGKLSSVVGHEGPLTSADGAAFNHLEIEKTQQ